jgi:hypothetical protein
MFRAQFISLFNIKTTSSLSHVRPKPRFRVASVGFDSAITRLNVILTHVIQDSGLWNGFIVLRSMGFGLDQPVQDCGGVWTGTTRSGLWCMDCIQTVRDFGV